MTYDLNAPGSDYNAVYDYLRSLGAWARPTESTWLIKTDKTVAQLRNELKNQIDENDKVFIIDVTGRACAWSGLNDQVSQWISNKL